MSIHTHHDPRIQDFLDRHDPDLVLSAFRDRQGGPAHMRRLGSIARAVIRSGTAPRRILDLFCGPGDLGRTLGLLEPGSRVDFVDSDPFALALAARINRRRRVRGRLVQADLWDPDWSQTLEGGYDVITVGQGICRLDTDRAAELLDELTLLLKGGGQLVLEAPAHPSGEGLDEDDTSDRWHALFRRLDRHLGYPRRRGLVSMVPPGRHPIDDVGLRVRDYVRLLSDAGFTHTEVLDRGARHVCLWAMRADSCRSAA